MLSHILALPPVLFCSPCSPPTMEMNLLLIVLFQINVPLQHFPISFIQRERKEALPIESPWSPDTDILLPLGSFTTVAFLLVCLFVCFRFFTLGMLLLRAGTKAPFPHRYAGHHSCTVSVQPISTGLTFVLCFLP